MNETCKNDISSSDIANRRFETSVLWALVLVRMAIVWNLGADLCQQSFSMILKLPSVFVSSSSSQILAFFRCLGSGGLLLEFMLWYSTSVCDRYLVLAVLLAPVFCIATTTTRENVDVVDSTTKDQRLAPDLTHARSNPLEHIQVSAKSKAEKV